jgi:hypothetical protein
VVEPAKEPEPAIEPEPKEPDITEPEIEEESKEPTMLDKWKKWLTDLMNGVTE